MKRLICVLLALLMIPGVLSAVLTRSGTSDLAVAAEGKTHSGLLTITDPTMDQIRIEYAKYKKPTARFVTVPSAKYPYVVGKLDKIVLQMATNRINYYRFISKLPPLTNSESKNQLAQYGAVLVAACGITAHQPPRPSDMSEAFYNEALIGANNSNISSFSYKSLMQSSGWTWAQVNEHKTQEMLSYALMFQIRDYDSNVYNTVGHRRYLLSPYLREFGIGVADSANGYETYYVVNHAGRYGPFSELNYDVSYDYVAWPPSGNCPNDMMLKTFPWHVSLNEDKYYVPIVLDSNGQKTTVGDRTGVVVTVTRASDGRVWTFNDRSPSSTTGFSPKNAYKSPFFVIDKHAYGFGPVREEIVSPILSRRFFACNAIIFRPDFEDNTPLLGRYKVRITGLKKVDGSPAEINYEVNFFDIAGCDHSWGAWTVNRAATCTEEGERTHNCTKCGASESQTISPLGHSWSNWTQVKAPTCVAVGLQKHICSRCSEVETESIPALGHAWGSETVTKEPTCILAGERNVVCGRCGATEHQTIPALGHNWDNGVVLVEPTYDEKGDCLFTCLRCGATQHEALPKLERENPFTDVKKGKYYYSPTLWAYYHEPQITSGTDATHFSPNATCTREQVMTFLYAAYNKPEHHQVENPFKDVKKKYYYNAVMWAVENEITGGVSADAFGVGVSCKREQVVTFLWKAAGKPSPTITENPFTDVKRGKYFYKAVLWAVENKITSGVTKTTFGVGKTCTRGQIVTFLHAALENKD